MRPHLRVVERTLARPPPGPGVPQRILRLVRSAPERQAIAAGEVDAVVDPASGAVFLLPDAQKALDGAQARVSSLLALSADWTWEQDETYRFVSHASTAGVASVPDEESLVGKPLWELGFDTAGAIDWGVHVAQLDARATFRDLELRWINAAGKMRGLSVSGEPTFDEQGRFSGYRGTMRDISQREPPEARPQVARKNVPERRRELPDPLAQQGVRENRLLATLPRNDRQALLASLEAVELVHAEVLYEPGQLVRHVYFPTGCLVSLRTAVQERQALEVGLVGREGMVGISVVLGMRVSCVRAVLMSPGTALRMTAADFRREFGRSPSLQSTLYRYAHAKLALARQTAACNRFHMMGARLAGWLLMASDQIGSDTFYFTQAALADMLGVRREGVTEAACGMEQRNLISYRRGNIRLLDRKGLEAASCGCYRQVRDTQSRASVA